MYGYSSAFNLFISNAGLPVFVERVKVSFVLVDSARQGSFSDCLFPFQDEIELCVEAHSSIASTSAATIDAPTGLSPA